MSNSFSNQTHAVFFYCNRYRQQQLTFKTQVKYDLFCHDVEQQDVDLRTLGHLLSVS